MRAVVQRVTKASVRVDGEDIASIGPGLLILVGVGTSDTEQDALRLADKVRTLRIFPDEGGQMNRSIEDTGGEILAVSQFTLWGDARKGRRPSFIDAAAPDRAEPLYRLVCEALRGAGVRVGEGLFRALMQVELINDGPVTILLDTSRAF